MKTIKFVDIRDYDTNTSSIAAHLTEALKRIRKKIQEPISNDTINRRRQI